VLTYKEISAKYNIPENTLKARATLFKVKGKFFAPYKYFSQDEIDILVAERKKNPFNGITKKNHRRKLGIIESYLKRGSGREVSRVLNIPLEAVLEAIKEFKNTGCLVVESKMNRQEV